MTPQSDPTLEVKKLTKRVNDLEGTNSILQGQVDQMQQQMAQLQNQMDIKFFLSNPSTVNLNGGSS